MNDFSLKNRIAFNYIISTALLVLFVSIAIYTVVHISVSNHLDKDLEKEVKKHTKEIQVTDGKITLKRYSEWMEREHNTVGVDPVFIEFISAEGELIDKSPNLKEQALLYIPKQADNVFFDSRLADKSIRQVQVPIFNKEEKVGYLLIAVSLEGQKVVLDTLLKILLLAYPFILIVLFFAARFIAGESIKPINSIIEISNNITRDNLTSRVPLPHNKDELYILSETINNLLDRIERAIEREQSFTTYASHEFRTPLAVLKGTLEVLIRKPRKQEEYEHKISFCIKEVDRLNHLVDQLLLLTRFENQQRTLKLEKILIENMIIPILDRLSVPIKQKNIHVVTSFEDHIYAETDMYLFSIILSNLISNAVKYSKNNGIVKIVIRKEETNAIFEIFDSGIGISEEDMEKIFDNFYRAQTYENSHIKGFGLGLAIVKRFCLLLNINIHISSRENQGTHVKLTIP